MSLLRRFITAISSRSCLASSVPNASSSPHKCHMLTCKEWNNCMLYIYIILWIYYDILYYIYTHIVIAHFISLPASSLRSRASSEAIRPPSRSELTKLERSNSCSDFRGSNPWVKRRSQLRTKMSKNYAISWRRRSFSIRDWQVV